MSHRKSWIAVLFGFTLAVSSLLAQEAKLAKNPGIVDGPGLGNLGAVASVKVPTGYVFYDGEVTRMVLKKEGEPISGREMGMLSPTNEPWSVFFDFSEDGYVKDDEKDKLDSLKDSLLKSFISGNNEANKQRVAAGRPPLEIVGWEVPPKYDEKSHNLEWALRLSSEGRPLLNYNTRILGRKGVMEVVLVVDPENFAETLPKFRQTLADYQYGSGQSYAEFRQGDKIAEYGLGALILGGAAVGAAKLGLLGWLLPFIKKIWVFLVAGVVAVARFFKQTFKAFFGRPDKK